MNTDGLYSLVLMLSPVREARVAATVGDQAHAAFLQTIRRVDAGLAQSLHAPDSPVRPFTVSSLRGAPPACDGQLRLLPHERLWLRITLLNSTIFQQFVSHFLRGAERPTIQLGAAEMLIHEILVTPESHPWANYSSWENLAEDAAPAEEITLAFVSPTAFGFGQKAWGKKTIVLPEPTLVFGSLLRTWNSLAPDHLRLDRSALMAYVEENVVVSRLNSINTRILRFRKAPQVGFTGQVTYGLLDEEPIARRQCAMLADFAFYGGVGMKTSMGMGQCKRIVGNR